MFLLTRRKKSISIGISLQFDQKNKEKELASSPVAILPSRAAKINNKKKVSFLFGQMEKKVSLELEE